MKLDELNHKLYEAQKDKDTLRISVLRLLISAIKNKEIELRPQDQELTDEAIAGVIQKQMKQRKESIEMYESAGRDDSAESEKKELAILEELLNE